MKLLLTLLALTLITSCTIEKRLYRPGYHIESSLFKKSSRESTGRKNITKLPRKEEIVVQFENKVSPSSLDAEPALTQFSIPCDTMVMANGDRLTVKVETITEDKIVYLKCENLEGPRYEVRLSKVDYVVYANGQIEKIIPQTPEKSNNNTVASSEESATGNSNGAKEKKQFEPFGVASLSALLLALFISSLVPTVASVLTLASLVLAIISLVRFKAEPKKFRGKWMPQTVLIFFIISFIIGIVVISTLYLAAIL